MKPHPKSVARDFTVQFLYQCESEKVYFFSENHLRTFIDHFQVSGELAETVRTMAKGVLQILQECDDYIAQASTRWQLDRLGTTDRAVLRLAAYELLKTDTPPKVALNEAIELAKKYGTEQSGSFVNGVLDAMLKRIQAEKGKT